MSGMALGQVIKHSPNRGATLLCELMIADCVNDMHGWEFWMSNTTLAGKARVSRQCANTAVKELIRQGRLTLLSAETGKTTRYKWVQYDGDSITQHETYPPLVTPVDTYPPETTYPPPVAPVDNTCRPLRQYLSPPLTIPVAPVDTNEKECKKNVTETKNKSPIVPISNQAIVSPPGEDIRVVFDAWVVSTGKTNKTQLDNKRRRLIKQALIQYPLGDVVAAVQGWKHSDFHCGVNDRGTIYNDLGLLLRDASQIEKFRDLTFQGPTNPKTPNQTLLEKLMEEALIEEKTIEGEVI